MDRLHLDAAPDNQRHRKALAEQLVTTTQQLAVIRDTHGSNDDTTQT